jgi:hypothetical protein
MEDLGEWFASGVDLLDEYERRGRVMYAYPCHVRFLNVLVCPCCCGLCCAWALLARLLTCSCRANKGTQACDACVTSYWQDTFARRSLPAIPRLGGIANHPSTIDAARTFARKIRQQFILEESGLLKPCTAGMYELADVLFSATLDARYGIRNCRCMPSDVHSYLCAIEDWIDANETATKNATNTN